MNASRPKNLTTKPGTSQGAYYPTKKNLKNSSARGAAKKISPSNSQSRRLHRKDSIGRVQKKSPGREPLKHKRSPPTRRQQIPSRYNSTSNKTVMPPLVYHKVSDLRKKACPLKRPGRVADQHEQKMFDLCRMRLLSSEDYQPSSNYTLAISTSAGRTSTSPKLFALPHASPASRQPGLRSNLTAAKSTQTNQQSFTERSVTNENTIPNGPQKQRRKRGDRKKQKEEYSFTARKLL